MPDDQALALAGGLPIAYDPGYDYEPSLWTADTFGLIELRHRPLVSVQTIIFNYPVPTETFFSVPQDWIRFEPRSGRVNLVPDQSAISLPLTTFIMAAFGGGQRIPLIMQCAYQAGLINVKDTYPDLVNIIMRMAVLDIIDDLFLPGSGSVSGDGLSQSTSWDSGKMRDTLMGQLVALRRKIHGIVAIIV